MGSYIECLLDEGELPRLGAESSPDSQCDQNFESFSFAEGRPPAAVRGKNGNSNYASVRGQNLPYTASTFSGSTKSSGASGAAGRPTGATEGSGKNQKSVSTPLTGSSENIYGRNSNLTTQGSQTSRLPLSLPVQNLTENQKRRLKKTSGEAKKVAEIENSESSQKQKGVPVKKSDGRNSQAPVEIEPWDFSRILKYALIIMILMALLLFIGLQAQQIRKSIEKN